MIHAACLHSTRYCASTDKGTHAPQSDSRPPSHRYILILLQDRHSSGHTRYFFISTTKNTPTNSNLKINNTPIQDTTYWLLVHWRYVSTYKIQMTRSRTHPPTVNGHWLRRRFVRSPSFVVVRRSSFVVRSSSQQKRKTNERTKRTNERWHGNVHFLFGLRGVASSVRWTKRTTVQWMGGIDDWWAWSNETNTDRPNEQRTARNP